MEDTNNDNKNQREDYYNRSAYSHQSELRRSQRIRESDNQNKHGKSRLVRTSVQRTTLCVFFFIAMVFFLSLMIIYCAMVRRAIVSDFNDVIVTLAMDSELREIISKVSVSFKCSGASQFDERVEVQSSDVGITGKQFEIKRGSSCKARITSLDECKERTQKLIIDDLSPDRMTLAVGCPSSVMEEMMEERYSHMIDQGMDDHNHGVFQVNLNSQRRMRMRRLSVLLENNQQGRQNENEFDWLRDLMLDNDDNKQTYQIKVENCDMYDLNEHDECAVSVSIAGTQLIWISMDQQMKDRYILRDKVTEDSSGYPELTLIIVKLLQSDGDTLMNDRLMASPHQLFVASKKQVKQLENGVHITGLNIGIRDHMSGQYYSAHACKDDIHHDQSSLSLLTALAQKMREESNSILFCEDHNHDGIIIINDDHSKLNQNMKKMEKNNEDSVTGCAIWIGQNEDNPHQRLFLALNIDDDSRWLIKSSKQPTKFNINVIKNPKQKECEFIMKHELFCEVTITIENEIKGSLKWEENGNDHQVIVGYTEVINPLIKADDDDPQRRFFVRRILDNEENISVNGLPVFEIQVRRQLVNSKVLYSHNYCVNKQQRWVLDEKGFQKAPLLCRL